MLNGDYSFRNSDNIKTHKINFLNKENLENEIKIYQCIENLPLRHNLDFTDFLWELLISKYILTNKYLYSYLYIKQYSYL